MKMTGNTILITGGGSGIGAALAQRFAALGNKVIIAGRREAALQKTCAGHPNMHFMVLDASNPQAIDKFAHELVQAYPKLNVLINNAGIMRFEDLSKKRDLHDAEETVETNLLGPIRLTNALVEHLEHQPDAVIINVTSGLAFVPLVSTPTYNATKAAIHSYTDSLREALKGKVEVLELAPPAVQTGLTPGQEKLEGYMPLKDFIDEVMTLLAKTPTSREILVKNVEPLRFAERNGQYDETLAHLNDFVARQRGNK
ncbi:SDR family NAD(P)-dependent oxidoreductase [Oecophyllibacter saccharovorans]|uniref:SDR family oxidoreductase n=1 Tax=Oecophyllibacter saccharovorans TaxID=2558360 RepID=UPI0011414DF0|nr:SDR family oxidoreductase [Oecophyllibacter saccharovorans]QDH15185.1 SDR family NAD(P)-dependent oxidoreductase [Oecophyllibacter saccharovorans]